MSEILRLENLHKSFGDTEVLKGIDLSVEQGEFITLLGSSGSGKTTILRIIAGLTDCDEGHVILEGKDVTSLPPEKRNVNTVFQSYALFPHKNVEKNIGYGLKIAGVGKAEIEERVKDALSLVQLEGFGRRMPHELSGGQRQRIAIARAIVNQPKVLLLDEPLGALDLKLRRQMQLELKRLQKQLGITFIYITHDQEEALNMSDRIAVLNSGEFEEIGSPSSIYDYPKTAYVAGFVGSANILKGRYTGNGSMLFDGCEMNVCTVNHTPKTDDEALCAVRSEYVNMSAEGPGIAAVIREKLYAGGLMRMTLDSSIGEIVATRHGNSVQFSEGDNVYLSFDKEHAVVVKGEKDEEKRNEE